MSRDTAVTQDETFFYSNLADYLDGELDGATNERFDTLLKQPEFSDVPEKFKETRGRLQVWLHDFNMSADDAARIRKIGFAEDESKVLDQEEEEEIDRSNLTTLIFRWLVFGGAIGGLVVWGLWNWQASRPESFDALQYLGYEAVYMVEEPDLRLAVPTDNIEDVKNYFAAHKGLEFDPTVLGNLGGEWRVQGATVIDYDVAKVVAVQYQLKGEPDDHIIHFAYQGSMSDLPKADVGKIGAIEYQTYASDRLNLVAWQQTEDVVAIVAGGLAAQELAALVAGAR